MSKSDKAKETEQVEDDDEPDDWYMKSIPRFNAPGLIVAVRDKRIFSTGCSGRPDAI